MIHIVIPTTNEHSGIETGRRAAEFFSGIQVSVCVVVDGAREELIKDLGKGVKVKYLRGLRGSYVARNSGAGMAASCARFLAFIDDGVVLRGQWNPTCLAEDFVLSGRVCFDRKPDNAYEKWYFSNAFRQDYFLERFGFVPTIFMISPKSVYERVSGFDESLTSSGDVDFCRRASLFARIKVIDQISVVTGLRGRSSIYKKMARQVYGQMSLVRKERGAVSAFLHNLLRIVVNILGVPGVKAGGVGVFLVNYRICLYKSYLILSGLFLTSGELDVLMVKANRDEVFSEG